ncbi:class I SAM-dependent methyltransferase [Thermopolyspora sp. NPDC052614]|uniref:class I SAM-dependent methyltransferase n=1 Tax=Thermopolyspora sp. NPDC052614 TaxID=3155682 RepID=UPI0034202ADD
MEEEPSSLSTVRSAYDVVADLYAETFRGALDAQPLDRAMLAVFAELVRSSGGGPVADVGCGPARLTGHLASLGLDVFGTDLSPEMIRLAREAYPDLRFDVGSMTDLKAADGALGGVLAWYSVIHTPPERLPEIFAEFRRVLAPGGHLLLGFQATDDPKCLTEAFDHKVTLAYKLSVDGVADLLRAEGFDVRAKLAREPEDGVRFTQAALLARRPGPK